jgi:hypothetical protein
MRHFGDEKPPKPLRSKGNPLAPLYPLPPSCLQIVAVYEDRAQGL